MSTARIVYKEIGREVLKEVLKVEVSELLNFLHSH